VVDSDDFDIKSVVPLLKQVIKRAADKDIWTAVISLVSLRATPPSISNKAALDTPLKSISSSQQGNEQTHDETDPRILQAICTASLALPALIEQLDSRLFIPILNSLPL
jgi:hypothetical protein